MNQPIEQSMDRIATAADSGLHSLVNGARQRSKRAAQRVTAGKKPLQALAGLGLKLSAVSHRTTDRILKQQTALTANQLDLIALRFESAADASCLRDLVKKQIRLTPEQLSRLGRDTRASFGIVLDAGSEARDVVADTLGSLRKPRKVAKAPARKAAKTTKKTVAKASKSAKKTSKKVVRKAAGKTAAAADKVASAS
ncbi:hypothetical protein [Woeseia oceani]|uniref:Phasin domain-containing protein n=1 Tax=Woeseia oceani TaxID=1548547 RepID=A0A193LER9_9GAMM|nr:hypothetical protein [Woeseia oceani]ANO51025.1 hypothetical protein BA177_07220 [Woeseia oceani]